MKHLTRLDEEMGEELATSDQKLNAERAGCEVDGGRQFGSPATRVSECPVVWLADCNKVKSSLPPVRKKVHSSNERAFFGNEHAFAFFREGAIFDSQIRF